MVQTITPGRWRGLRATSLDTHVFTILAFDQRGTFRKMLPDGTSYETAVHIKRDVVVALAPHVSAVLLDAAYGLSSALDMSGSSGLLMSLEKSGYSGDSTYRHMDFDPNWTIEKIRRMGASAVKLLVYYHPDSGELAEEIEKTVQKVCQECHEYDIPVFLEPMSYSLDTKVKKESAEFAKTRPKVVQETARRLSQLQPDVLKLEFPVDAEVDQDEAHWRQTCEAISQVSVVPWVLLSAGVDFEMFERQTQVACQSGASGFLAGRAIWKEAVTMPDSERQKFLAETAVPRLNRLTDVTLKYARPWTNFYQPIPASETWFKTY